MTSAERIKTLKTIRGKDLKIRYTQDSFEDTVISQRQFYDENGVAIAPVTPKLLERQVVTNNPIIAKVGTLEPRSVSVCFGSKVNKSGESNFKVFIPYHPGDAGHNEQIQEVLNYTSSSQSVEPKSPLRLTYSGENR
ncbi:hypothetical protein [Microcoleus sp. CAWBG640]|uniref:hypothetical protein n=1 Tax=Microcoleus sp. CAWBG640 TaxID=2841653 RepID=UPI00312BA39F